MKDMIVGIVEKKIIIDENDEFPCGNGMYCSKECDFYNEGLMAGSTSCSANHCSLYNVCLQIDNFSNPMRYHDCITTYGSNAL